MPGGWWPPMQVPDRVRDGETYVTTAEAAALMRVAVSTVSRWKAKGYSAGPWESAAEAHLRLHRCH